MNDHLKQFANHSAYSAAESQLMKPNVSYCIQENEVHYKPYIHDYADDYLTFVALENGTFTFIPYDNSNIINYSTDNGNTWITGNTINVNSGDKILWKGTMNPTRYDGIGRFSSTCNFNVEGNIMSLIYNDSFDGQIDLTGKDWVFQGLFQQATKLINAKNLSLPATTLANDCYGAMFSSCSNLVTAPNLPAEILLSSCYSGMFAYCTSLTTTPQLSATTLSDQCYRSMFEGCTSLISVSNLPATTLAQSCYYEMFAGCTSLTVAPELPATTLVDDCYRGMFDGCTNLNYIKCLATNLVNTRNTYNWVNNVANSGTFIKDGSMTNWTIGVGGIPSGWTVENA